MARNSVRYEKVNLPSESRRMYRVIDKETGEYMGRVATWADTPKAGWDAYTAAGHVGSCKTRREATNEVVTEHAVKRDTEARRDYAALRTDTLPA